MTPEFRTETLAGIEAVQAGLAIAERRLGTASSTSKGGRDLVTDADIAVEDAISALLADRLPIPVIGEDRGRALPSGGAAYWLVDPICGTRNFASAIPLFAVNVALVEAATVQSAVVGDGSTGEIYVAECGLGAWAIRDGSSQRIAPSTASETIVVEDSKCAGARREHAARFTAHVIRQDRWYFRALGTSLALVYVASGRVTAYVDFLATALHSAAGMLVATEAGTAVSDIEGEPWTLDSTSLMVSATADLHTELVEASLAAKAG